MLKKISSYKEGWLIREGWLKEDSRYNAKASAKSPVTKIRRHCGCLNTITDL